MHNYERTCAIYDHECKGMPKKDEDGIDTYDNSNYTAPVQAVIGMAGFSLDKFPDDDVSITLHAFEFVYFVYVSMFISVHTFYFCPWIQDNAWSLSRISEYGYVRGHATREELKMEVSFVCL